MPAGRHELPDGFVTVAALLAGEVKVGTLVNVVGMVTDHQVPVATSGPTGDWKSSITIRDFHVEGEEQEGIKFNIFRKQNEMPQEVDLKDVFVLFRAKFQSYMGGLSLITNRATTLCRYSAKKIPRPPNSAKVALVPISKRDSKSPPDELHHFVSFHFHRTDIQFYLPDEDAFRQKTEASGNTRQRQKFSELKDVQDGHFYDLIGIVARDPWSNGGTVTLYLTDYTENGQFFDYSADGPTGTSNPYGYREPSPSETSSWQGPAGKRTIQITCFQPHADYVEKEVKAGMLVRLANVRVTYGRNDIRNLEGKMDGERNFNGQSKVNVHIYDLDSPDVLVNLDPRAKSVLERSRQYHKSMKKRKVEVDEAVEKAKAAGAKRRSVQERDGQQSDAATTTKTKSKSAQKRLNRRKRERELAREGQGQAQKTQSPQPAQPTTTTSAEFRTSRQVSEESAHDESLPEDLLPDESSPDDNPFIECERPRGASPVPVSKLLGPQIVERYSDGRKTPFPVPAPFKSDNNLIRVRVVDFEPKSLQEFAVQCKITLKERLREAGSSDEESLSSSSDDDTLEPGDQMVWEWSFKLKLEEANRISRSRPADSLWVRVNNSAGQCLTNLDAGDLSQDETKLAQLRERMYILWGNLEEIKQLQNKPKKIQRNPLTDEPPDSEDEEDCPKLSNKPFICCVRQFGIPKSREKDNKEFTQAFVLHGTKIKGQV